MPKVSSYVSPSDLTLVSAQMGGRRFNPSGVAGIAKRCRWGVPQVLKCYPLRDGWPFPTTYWLSCPWLIKLAGLLESHGGVSSLEAFLCRDRAGWIGYHMLHGLARISMMSAGEKRFLRIYRRPIWDSLRRGGIGGIDYLRSPDLSVKCLHLQIASWLALGHHPGQAWLAEHVSQVSCESGRCLVDSSIPLDKETSK